MEWKNRQPRNIMFNVPRDGQMGARQIKRDNTIRAIVYVLKDFNELG